MTQLSTYQKKIIIKRVFRRMKEIPHLNSFITERGSLYASKFISESIEAFYDAFIQFNSEKLFIN